MAEHAPKRKWLTRAAKKTTKQRIAHQATMFRVLVLVWRKMRKLKRKVRNLKVRLFRTHNWYMTFLYLFWVHFCSTPVQLCVEYKSKLKQCSNMPASITFVNILPDYPW